MRQGQDRKVPGLTFIIPLNMTFTVSLDYKTSEDFKNIARNKDEDMSKLLRSFVFKKLGVKDKKDFENFMFEVIEVGKSKIYVKLEVNRQNSFSKVLLNEIQRYIKENEN